MQRSRTERRFLPLFTIVGSCDTRGNRTCLTYSFKMIIFCNKRKNTITTTSEILKNLLLKHTFSFNCFFRWCGVPFRPCIALALPLNIRRPRQMASSCFDCETSKSNLSSQCRNPTERKLVEHSSSNCPAQLAKEL